MAEASSGVFEGDSLLTSAPTGEAGFCFSEGAGGGVCGWVFLARMSALLPEAETEREVLAGEGRGEPGAGSARHAASARARLECVSDLGVSLEGAAGSECPADRPDAGGLTAKSAEITKIFLTTEGTEFPEGAGVFFLRFRFFSVFRG